MRRLSGFRQIMVVVIVATAALPAAPVNAVQDPFCGDVQLVWARGTGRQPADDPEFGIVNAALDERVGDSISYSSYRLGLDGGFGGFEYPAEGDLWEYFFEWTDINAGRYASSVAEGRAELDAYLTHRTVECPGEVYVLAGWSQGAQVLGEGLFMLDQSIQDRIAYVAFFGDPTFTSVNVEVLPLTNICYFPKQPWSRGTSECWSSGVFGSRFPYIPEEMENRVSSWCRDGDGACTGIANDIILSTGPEPQGQHFQYFEPNGDSAMAMHDAAEALKTFIPDQANDLDSSFLQFATGSAGADLAFIFDTTGSMFGEIEDAKAEATALANLWLNLSTNGRVALVEFRDQGDSFVSRVDLQLTSDESAFQSAVNALEADEGGDFPEAQLSGVMAALDGLAWQNAATKAAIIITDAPGRDPEPVTGFTRAQVAQRALEIDPVAIYGVDVVNSAQVTDFMEPLATATAGDVVVLEPGQSLSDALADLINYVAMSPVADLDGPYYALTGNPVHFTAVRSFDPDADLVSYEWDFDGNGISDQTTTSPTVDHTYTGAFNGIAAVRIVSADGGEALATAEVTVDNVGFADDVPLAPTSATATITAPGQVNVSWTPTANDRADGYKVSLTGTLIARLALTSAPDSIVFTGVDTSEPVEFLVQSSNTFGYSAGVATPPVGGEVAVATTRVSESTTNGQGNGVSDDSYISADGRHVTYRSTSSNLVNGDTNGVTDVFVHDRLTETTSRASLDAAGVEGNAQSDDSAISADGRYVVFKSQASNFVTGDTNGTSWDIFRKDLQTGAIVRVSTSSSGAQSNGASHDPVISADGRYVVFRSSASNLVAGDTNGQQDIFRKDVETGTTVLVSVSTAGVQGDALADDPQVSDDGSRIAFHSDATTLVSGDTNGHRDVFVRDVTAGTTVRVSVSTAGAQGDGLSAEASISGDGTTVAWESDASNLVSDDTNAKTDVFVRVLATGVTSRASVSEAGAQGTKDSESPSLSTDGLEIAFESLAAQLISGDTNSRKDIFIKDLASGAVTRMSVDTAGVQGNDTSRNASISGDGSTVAFESNSSNLVANDTNGSQDVFVRGPSLAQ